MKFYTYLISIILLFAACGNQKQETKPSSTFEGIPIIRLDREAISGIGLKPVQNKNQPDRRLFQKRLIRGTDLSVYVVSSETAIAKQDNYAMEEFIKLVNGRSRMNPTNGDEIIFETGDSFIAPKGFTGEWETIGGDEFLIELSIISTERQEGQRKEIETLPYLIDKKVRSGIGIPNNKHQIYNGIELTVSMENTKPSTIEHSAPMQEQVVEVLSGKITITPSCGEPEIFVCGDYFMIPKDFIGSFQYEGHGTIRTMHILKSPEKS